MLVARKHTWNWVQYTCPKIWKFFFN